MQGITIENTPVPNTVMLKKTIQAECIREMDALKSQRQEEGLGLRLIYVMGPSGAGKDSVMNYAREQINGAYSLSWQSGCQGSKHLRPLVFARRYITRPREQETSGCEYHYPISPENFQQLKAQNGFALDWESHGLLYGISAEIDRLLVANVVVIVNGSRKALPQALSRYPKLLPVLIEAQQEILQRRLELRKREEKADIIRRLSQSAIALPELPRLIRIDNSFALTKAGELFTAVVRQVREHKTV